MIQDPPMLVSHTQLHSSTPEPPPHLVHEPCMCLPEGLVAQRRTHTPKRRPANNTGIVPTSRRCC